MPTTTFNETFLQNYDKMKTKKDYRRPEMRVCRCTAEQGFATSAELPYIYDDWTNNDYE